MHVHEIPQVIIPGSSTLKGRDSPSRNSSADSGSTGPPYPANSAGSGRQHRHGTGLLHHPSRGEQETERTTLDKEAVQRITERIAKYPGTPIPGLKLSHYAGVMKMKVFGKVQWISGGRTIFYDVDSGSLGISVSRLPYAGPTGKRRRGPRRMAYTNGGGKSVDKRPEETANLYFERRTA